LQLERKTFRPAQLSKSVLAVLLMAAVFASLFLSVSPSHHEHLHHDAAQSSHQCAITVFEQQHLLTSNPNVIIVEQNFGILLTIAVSDCTAVSDFDYRFSASRAPPFILSPLV
jgi:hypothetical protein